MNDALKSQIFQKAKKEGEITVRAICETLGISRNYANIILKQLREEGELVLIGQTNRAKYVFAADNKKLLEQKRKIQHILFRLPIKGLLEDAVLDRLERETGILLDLNENVVRIFRHAFTEMLNNAIDHSQSPTAAIDCRRTDTTVTFVVRDFGIGIFNNVRAKFRLPGTLAAIQEILKGKTTTIPAHHSGEGVFFTSKMADAFIIDSFEKRLTVNNLLPDIFISDRKPLQGTRVSFSIHASSKRKVADVYKKFTGQTDDGFAFDKTNVTIRLFQFGTNLPSRSEAKRVTMNLDKFQEIELDFTDVNTVGQAFADEIFRVWQNRHPDIKLICTHANENVIFMVKRAGGKAV